MEGMIGEVRLFAGNFAPRAWAFCAGQLLAISQNNALFSILGTTYGGDGRTSFGLPDLRGRADLGSGTGPGLPSYSQGQKVGSTTVTLTINQLPSHSHALLCNSSEGTLNSPQNAYAAAGRLDGVPPNQSAISDQYSSTANTQMNSLAVSNDGGNQAHTNMQPSLALNYVICMFGVYPSRS